MSELRDPIRSSTGEQLSGDSAAELRRLLDESREAIDRVERVGDQSERIQKMWERLSLPRS